MNNISIWKRLLFIFLTVSIIFIVGYFIFTWRNLPEIDIPDDAQTVTLESEVKTNEKK